MTKRKNFDKSLLEAQCSECGSVKALEQDHWDNDSSNDSPSNCRTLCHACHREKTRIANQIGMDRAKQTNNKDFTRWAMEARADLGKDGFRERQDKINDARLKSLKVAEMQREFERNGLVLRYDIECTDRANPHRYELSSEQLVYSGDRCLECLKPVTVLAEKIMRRIVLGKESVHIELSRKSLTPAATPSLTSLDLLVAFVIGRLRSN